MKIYGEDKVKGTDSVMKKWKAFKDKETGKWGYKYKNKVVIPARFYEVPDTFEQDSNLIPVQEVTGDGIRAGYLNVEQYQKTGEIYVKYEFDTASVFYNGYASVSIGGKYALINEQGKTLTCFVYEDMFKMKGGLVAVRLNGKWGYIDGKGNEVIPCKYDAVTSFDLGIAAVKMNGKWGCIDKDGYIVVKCKYTQEELETILAWNSGDGLYKNLEDNERVKDIATIYTIQTNTMISIAKSDNDVKKIVKVYEKEMKKLTIAKSKVDKRLAKEEAQRAALEEKKEEAIDEIDRILQESNLVEEDGLNV